MKNNTIHIMLRFNIMPFLMLISFLVSALFTSCVQEDDIPPVSAYVEPPPPEPGENIIEAPVFSEVPVDFETSNPEFESFGELNGDVIITVVENPVSGGINTSGKVVEVKYLAGTQPWAGFFFDLAEKVDFSVNRTIKIKVYSPEVGQNITLKLEDKEDANIKNEKSELTTVANEWEELSFVFSPGDDAKFDRAVLFFNFLGDKDADTTHYFDDIVLVEGDGSGGGPAGEPTVGAPAPILTEADVISIYSDAYAGTSSAATVDMFVTDWSVLASQTEALIGGNNTLVYSELNFAGIITETSPIDASGMEFFHVDVWTSDVSTFKIKFVDFNGTGYNNNTDNIEFEVENAIDPAGEWISLDIPLSDFVGVPFSDINQMVISAVPAGTTVFLDNLYFWKQPAEFNNLPVNFDNSSLTYNWTGFGDPGFGPIPTAIIANPDPSGINITTNVLEIQKPVGSQVWAGASMPVFNPIDFANNGTTLTIKVWSPRAGVPILFKTEDPSSPPDGNGNPSVFAEVIATTTKANQWEELSFDMTSFAGFSTSINYENIIIFPDFGNVGQGETFYFDDIEFASIKFPINLETSSLTYTWSGFGDPGFGPIPTAIISNPDPSGINTSGTVLEVQKPAGSQVWAGAAMPLDAPIDFTYGTTVKIKVWSPRAGVPILFKTEDPSSPPDGNGNPSVFVEVIGTTNTANGWEEVTFDLTSFGSFSTSIEYENVIVFPDFGSTGQGETFYFDDFILTN